MTYLLRRWVLKTNTPRPLLRGTDRLAKLGILSWFTFTWWVPSSWMARGHNGILQHSLALALDGGIVHLCPHYDVIPHIAHVKFSKTQVVPAQRRRGNA